ncbi:MAG: ATP-binding protein [Pyrinomonadaceae bacterium]
MFDKLAGNHHAKEILQRLLANGRVPHSFLFAGEEGVGKKLFALELAKAFICQNPQMGEACDVCGACKRADNFSFPNSDKKEDYEKVFFSEHPDIGMVIPFKNSILVDAVRQLEREANFRPFEGRARIFIIDDAEKLNAAKDNSANALLKTLEEPSPTTYIFLITSRPDALLPTILSRCQTLRFAPLEAKQIEGFLEGAKQFAIDDAEIVSKFANGSVGRALRMDVGKFRERRESMFVVLKSLLVKRDRAALLKIAEEMGDAKNKDFYEIYLNILQTLIHDVWILRLGRPEGNITNADLKAELKRLAENADSRILATWLAEIEILRGNLNVNLNRKIATDALFMQMASS